MGLLMSGFGLGAAGGVYAQDLPPIKIGEINTYSPALAVAHVAASQKPYFWPRSR